jgi:hypothetical protein
LATQDIHGTEIPKTFDHNILSHNGIAEVELKQKGILPAILDGNFFLYENKMAKQLLLGICFVQTSFRLHELTKAFERKNFRH